jgi:signal transduction histidine kinase
MLARLQAAFQAQRRFVADASHELRTPLTSIRGNLGLLQRQPPIAEADQIAVLADLVSESERLSRLVADLLTLARSDTGRPPRQEPVPLGPLVADVIRRIAASHPDRLIHEDADVHAVALGDPDAITQVLFILLDNALKFTPPDGTVSVTTGVRDGVVIAVHDTGPGIAADALPQVFERFYQGDVARAGSGTGLGLPIAKALVEGLRGTIEVESRVGAGSTFTVTLPRAATPARE